MKAKKGLLAIIYIFLIVAILFGIMLKAKMTQFISFGADTTTISVSSSLEKYINYNLSKEEMSEDSMLEEDMPEDSILKEDKGTLVQYKIATKIEYGEESAPVNKNEVTVHFGEIEEEYPKKVNVITDNNREITKTYNQETGKLLIEENKGDNNVSEDTYIVICYYDAYNEENEEREIEAKVEAKSIIENENENENEIEITDEEECKNTVSENIGELTSIESTTEEIYNGKIKSNIINKTEYGTEYKQEEKIEVSKKEDHKAINITEENTFIRETEEKVDDTTEETEKQIEELGNNNNLVYKSTEVRREDIEAVLGEEGVLEVLDKDENVLARVDKDTEFDEEGKYTIVYENQPESIKIRTSEVEKEGILNLKHTKEIKSKMKETENVKIKTVVELNGTTTEIIDEIKETQTKVDIEVDNTKWSNKKQNEVIFDVQLNSTKLENNMFKNPSIRIELPEGIEKVVLGTSSIIYGNGLELQDPYVEAGENGRFTIVANITGAQTEYKNDELDLVTDVKIKADIILNKAMDVSTNEKINIVYTNEFTVDNSIETENKEIEVSLESYQEDKQEEQEISQLFSSSEQTPLTQEHNDNLKLEVVPVRGGTRVK